MMRLFAPATTAIAPIAGLSLAAAVLVPLGATLPASANPAGTGLVISEVYGAGGNAGAVLNQDFIELYNPTDAAISVDGMSVQYRSATSTAVASGATALSGSVPAKATYLIAQAGGATGAALPTPDKTGSFNISGTTGTVFLANVPTAINPTAAPGNVVDLVGFGTSNTFETKVAPAPGATTSIARNAVGADTDNNSVDFTAGAPTPTPKPATPGPDPTPSVKAIAEIQGTGAASPLVGQSVITRGVVTANYPAGGFDGFFLQTPGTGGEPDATPGASDGLFVYGLGFDESTLTVGDFVEVNGKVSEYKGMTQVTAATAASVVKLTEGHAPVVPAAIAYPRTVEEREAHEGELLAPTGPFTVTNNYITNQYAEIGLASGTTPLLQPTDVAPPGSPEAAAVAADNAARAVALDDGASINFLPFDGGANQNIALPWLSQSNPVRVNSAVTFQQPVVLDYRNNTWKFQPTHQVTDEGTDVVTFEDTRAQNLAPRNVGGDLKLATFNVLNYFNTTGEAFVANGGTCSYYNDRAGDPVANNTCTPDGPRGAAQTEDFLRQQAKIVLAINTMDADIVSLEEIENSIKLIGETDRDDAIRALVDALNAQAGSTRWAFAPSPVAADLPPLAEQDVIRTGFIYNPAKVELVGSSKVLIGSAPFSNAREPLAQAFKVKGAPDADAFVVVVNHFKSKGGAGTGDNLDTGNGAGSFNGDRTRQAAALLDFANSFAAERGTDRVFLAGDFNSYGQEDPMQVLYQGGFAAVTSDEAHDETYSFSGLWGSLDHVLANSAAKAWVTGADVWQINANESIAFQYSRYNYNAKMLFDASNPFAASDHNPEIIGINTPAIMNDSLTSVTVDPASVTVGSGTSTVAVSVTTAGAPASGDVTVSVDGMTYPATLVDGKASVKVGPFTSTGEKTVTVSYLGNDTTNASTGSATIMVVKADSAATVTVDPASVVVGSGTSTVSVSVTSAGAPASGDITVSMGGTTYPATLVDGNASVKVGPFSTTGEKTVTVNYLGNSTTAASSGTASITVTAPKAKTSITGTILPGIVLAGFDAQISATVRGAGTPTGTVTAVMDGRTIGQGSLSGGKTKFRTTRLQRGGFRPITLSYSGDAANEPSSTRVWVWIWGF